MEAYSLLALFVARAFAQGGSQGDGSGIPDPPLRYEKHFYFLIIYLDTNETTSLHFYTGKITIQAASSSTSITTLTATAPAFTTSSVIASQTHLPSPSGTALPTSLATKPGLSTGAKAGIAIGALVAVLLILLATLFIRHRKSTRAPEVVPELPAENSTHYVPQKRISGLTRNSELDASPTQHGNAQQTFSQPYQPSHDLVGIFARDESPADAEMTSEPEPEPADVSSHTLLSDASGSGSGSSARMEELRAKRDKIKVEKERLLKLQELDEMEATVQREMLEEQRKSMGKVP
ncbi:hypothetical protein NA56DRAFT_705519 [Hyaloscypha hepaticicola]|uniref:Mid2 domain-containing protein n=1 Tax=Hyaloscypha hepaticicola TaxID=2082293 RepID=A0A2J6PZF9_9HELO|nr:hypothetical protein NA56DRAFT_705519 [Hyaloscypha hepaticicola]